MSYKVDGTTIKLTRGDSLSVLVQALLPDSEEVYEPIEGESVRFALKRSYDDLAPILVKDIPVDTMMLVLEPEDTKPLPFGLYVYDIQITFLDGQVDTFITKGRLRLTEEVD